MKHVQWNRSCSTEKIPPIMEKKEKKTPSLLQIQMETGQEALHGNQVPVKAGTSRPAWNMHCSATKHLLGLECRWKDCGVRWGWWSGGGGGTGQSVSVYQRFSGEKCKQFTWIGFPSKPEPQEAVKIELGEVREGWKGGRGGGLHLPHSRQLNRRYLPRPD